MMACRIVLVMALLACAGCTAQRPAADPVAADETIVILVRHAEAGGAPANDPPLTERGTARALALREQLRSAGVQAIFTSELARTRLTAAPLAAALGITPVAVSVRGGTVEQHVAETARRVLEQRGRTVLVVGHSNTVPAILAALGGEPVAPIAEDEFDRLYIVRIPPSGTPRVEAGMYGNVP